MTTHVEIDGRDFLLSDSHDVDDVMTKIEVAAGSAPAFVAISDDDRMVRVLIQATTRVVVYVDSPRAIEPEFEPPWISHSEWDPEAALPDL